jgi:TatD DNase family protein
VEVLREFKGSPLRGIFHCFSEGYEFAEEIAEMGFYFGIGGVVTYKNSGLAEVVARLPKDRILLETDAPYLAPVPQRGKRNEPAFVWHVAHKLSEVLGLSITEVGELTARNADRLFHNQD